MKNIKIQRLWLLVGCCLIGINTFQGYWLWRQYRAQQDTFSVTVKGALAQAVQQVKLGAAASILPMLDSMRINIQTTNGVQLRYREDRDTMIMVKHSWLGKERSQTADIHQIDSLFALELFRRGIREPYRLDTCSQAGNPAFNRFIQREKTVRGSDTLQSEQNVVMVFKLNDAPEHPDSIIATAPLDFGKQQYVRAAFPRHNYHILAGIAGTLLASLLLTLLTAGAFFYLLYIIQQQKKLAALKSDFINSMTHELQTPIATAAAAVEALQRFNALDNPVRTQEYLGIAQTQLNQLSGMVDQTLRLASEERAGFNFQKQPVEVAELIQPMLQSAQLAANRTVQLSFDNHLHRAVAVNAEHFAWAVQNLLDNAVKYCPKDRIPQVNIQAEAIDDHHWQLSVQDNGGGIPPAYQSKLFDRFYRAPSEGNVKGFGLGLYVAQRIVEAHGGQIHLKESSEKGSTFTIVLPF